MKKEIIDHVKKLKEQGANIKVDEDQIDDLINKIFDKKNEKYAKKMYIESEVDKFLEKYEDISISCDKDKDIGKYKNKFNTEEITKSLKKLRNKFININEFKEEYNKFMDNVKNFQNYKSKKDLGSVSKNQKKKKKWKDMQVI